MTVTRVIAAAALAALLAVVPAPAPAAETVRVGALRHGTVSWELDAMKSAGLDTLAGVDVEVVPFAGEDASNVAFLAGAVDVIVSDWLWVSRLRREGDDATFVPHSSAVGAVMVRPEGGIRSLADLEGRTIGVAGGPLDKSWLLVQGLARRETGRDLAAVSRVVYGAPPLLSHKAETGELDAVLTFWHFCARLEAKGFVRLVSAAEAAARLGSTGEVAALGWVFRESFARERPAALAGFLRASAATKELLATSDAEWDRLAATGVIRDEGAALAVLRRRYREGIPNRPVAEEAADAGRLHAILAELGGGKLVGPFAEMAPGTYFTAGGHGR